MLMLLPNMSLNVDPLDNNNNNNREKEKEKEKEYEYEWETNRPRLVTVSLANRVMNKHEAHTHK